MSRTAPPRPPRTDPGTCTARALPDLTAGALPVAGLSAASCWLIGIPTSHVLVALALYAGISGLLWWGLAGSPARPAVAGIGAANRVTLARTSLVVPVVTLAAGTGALPAVGAWWALALSVVALVLDAVDGPVARRTGTSSRLGARFDLEIDALLLMALSVLVLRQGQAGAWVLLIGALRYLFVLAGWLWSPLRAPLPPSFRRQAVCVVQGVALVVCLAPIVPSGVAGGLLGVALLLLIWSFAVDVAWLARAPGPLDRRTVTR